MYCRPIYSTVYVHSFFFMIIPELMRLLFLVYMYVLHCHVNSGNHVFVFAMSSIVIVLDVRILSDLLMPTIHLALSDYSLQTNDRACLQTEIRVSCVRFSCVDGASNKPEYLLETFDVTKWTSTSENSSLMGEERAYLKVLSYSH